MTYDITNLRVIAVDADGTILPHGREEISERTREAFAKASAKGYEIFVNTGRHYTFIPDSFFTDIPIEYIGTVNGAALVKRDGTVLTAREISENDMNRITAYCEEKGLGLGFKFRDSLVTYAHHQRFMDGYLVGEEQKGYLIKNGCDHTHHKTYGYPLGTFIIADEEDFRPLQEAFPEFTLAHSSKPGFDLFKTEVNKVLTAEDYLKIKGYTWENMIAFGDAGNDIPFLQKTAIGVAMGNGQDGIKEAADIIAPSISEDGVAYTLEKLGIV